MLPSELRTELEKHFGSFESRPLSGGSINEVLKISASSGNYCLKWNSASRYPRMFEKEAKGLEILRASCEVKVPTVDHWGETGNTAYLLLEFINSAGSAPNFWRDFGQRLAGLHRHTHEFFGLDHDNYMGSLEQSNRQHTDWCSFFISERLEVQLRYGKNHGLLPSNVIRSVEKVYRRLPEIFPPGFPSLLHGDLWSGNYMNGPSGYVCLIDPAVYYGHREIDIAMTRLFGGFDLEFYESYNDSWPLEKGWESRVDIFNLYPLLVHANLFGESYIGSIERIVKRF